ncbi:Forkhead box protein M1 [Nibea albiflora]|uniref:Forkhead box protein M1 n=1 Tax=Nibea albiflora TaxID=240163 RepID=A0ACB7EUQ0_NIBAL|nr:Forkhead box protein M1 [Nibea albiflora]
MRRSPRRPLILRRRKLPFQQNDVPAAEPQSQCRASGSKEPSEPAAGQHFPDGIRIMDHPSMSDTQVVVIPKTADLQSVIGALTAKGKEYGAHGPNKFILLSENGSGDNGSFCRPAAEDGDISTVGQPVETDTMNSPDVKPLTGIKAFNKDLECGPLDESLTNIQWLGRMNTCNLDPDPAAQTPNKENQDSNLQTQALNTQSDAEAVQQPMSERPPYSYMAMIQFAINSRNNRRMTAERDLHNSIRHNLSLHDMFIRETSPDGKISFWTIRPEANRCLTLDQVYKPGCDPMTAPVPVPMLLLPHQPQKRMLPDTRKTPTGSERRMKPLLPRTDSYLVPIQLPVASSVYLPSSSAQFPPSCSQQKQNTSRGAKRVRIAPKVTQSEAPAMVMYPQKSKDLKVKDEPECVPIKCETPKSLPERRASSSRRKQRLVHSQHEEPVLLCPDNTFFDSGVASDASTFQDIRDNTELEAHEPEQDQEHRSPDRDYSFKTPIKSSSSHLTSSTPSKPASNALPEPWKVTPVGKGSQSVLDFSPIRTPGGPTVTPRHDYTTFSFNSTPFKDWPLFSSPRELLTSAAPSRAAGQTDTPNRRSSELLQAGGGAYARQPLGHRGPRARHDERQPEQDTGGH